MIAGGAFGYSQSIIFWVFAVMFYVGAVLVDDGSVSYSDFFTAMFAVIFGAFGIGQVSQPASSQGGGEGDEPVPVPLRLSLCELWKPRDALHWCSSRVVRLAWQRSLLLYSLRADCERKACLFRAFDVLARADQHGPQGSGRGTTGRGPYLQARG